MAPMRYCVLASIVSTLLAGCFNNSSGVSPAAESEYLYYPVALGITEPEGRYLLVVNSNFDLAFNSGVVAPLDLEQVRGLVGACRGDGPECTELVVPSEAEAADERFGVLDFLLEDHAVLVGSYAGSVDVTEDLAIIPVRGDTSITFVDVNEVPSEDLGEHRILRCGLGEGADQPGRAQRCGSSNRVRSGVRLRDDAVLALPSEPFSVLSWDDPEGDEDYAVVGHMVSGEVSLLAVRDGLAAMPESCRDGEDDDGDGQTDADDPGCRGSKLELLDVDDSFSPGTSGLAVDPAGRFLAASRFETELTAFRVDGDSVVPSRTIAVGGSAGVSSDGDDQRGIAISPDGTRAYVVSREPEAVLVLDVTRDTSGRYEDRFVGIIEVGPGPSIIRIHEHENHPGGYMVYVVCFTADLVYVIDPSVNEVVDIVATRRGPHDLVFDSAAGVGYLANFLESTVSLLDVDPTSSEYHRVLTSLGAPRRPRSND